MATERTGPDSLRGSLVFAILAVVSGRGRASEGTWPGCRPHYGLASGTALRSDLEQRMRRYLKPTNKSWRVDETYIRVKGRWCYLYRAIDSAGATIDFLLSALRDADAAKRLFRKALSDRSHPQPRVINTGANLQLGHHRHKEGRDAPKT